MINLEPRNKSGFERKTQWPWSTKHVITDCYKYRSLPFHIFLSFRILTTTSKERNTSIIIEKKHKSQKWHTQTHKKGNKRSSRRSLFKQTQKWKYNIVKYVCFVRCKKTTKLSFSSAILWLELTIQYLTINDIILSIPMIQFIYLTISMKAGAG